MSDVLTPEQRRRNMSAIKGKDTKPEMIVRQALTAMGYRYRLHRKDLPGKPDIVFPGRRKVVEVRGCYWHMHDCPLGRVIPKTRTEFWQTKRQSNVTRDEKNEIELEKLNWKMLVIWECETKAAKADNAEQLKARLKEFLES